MPKYFLKPLVWNERNYERPSGVKVHDGYPKDFGFGHEEWNGSPRLRFEDENGRSWQAFHTQPLATREEDGQAGDDLFIFMIASHGGAQSLVGVAGRAQACLGNTERSKIRQALGLTSKEQRDEVWSLGNVRLAFDDDRNAFTERWNEEVSGFPSWKCPSDSYVWFDTPVELDARRITGKQRLATRYATSQSLSRVQALRILRMAIGAVGKAGRERATLETLIDLCGNDEADWEADIRDIDRGYPDEIGVTEKEALIRARRGQGRFRQDLVSRWRGCAVLGIETAAALRASHIRPWRDSSTKQRLDVDNGLLLSATLDGLFDNGLISFDDGGQLLVSEDIPPSERARLGLDEALSLRMKPPPV